MLDYYSLCLVIDKFCADNETGKESLPDGRYDADHGYSTASESAGRIKVLIEIFISLKPRGVNLLHPCEKQNGKLVEWSFD